MSRVELTIEERTTELTVADSGAIEVSVSPSRDALALRGKAVPTLPTSGRRVLLYDSAGAALVWDKVKAAEVDAESAAAGKILTAAGGTAAPTWASPAAPSVHAPSHAAAGSDPVTPAAIGAAAISHPHAGEDITSGTVDGDRLPAISQTKKGGVPATGVPSGKFLKDDSTWAAAGGGLPTPGAAHDILIGDAGVTAFAALGANRGRLRRRSWLDPDPQAALFAETNEFLTDMDQAALEAAGWTFEAGITGLVSNGVLWLTAASDRKSAYLTVSHAGAFDYVVSPAYPAADAPLCSDFLEALIGVSHGTVVRFLYTYTEYELTNPRSVTIGVWPGFTGSSVGIGTAAAVNASNISLRITRRASDNNVFLAWSPTADAVIYSTTNTNIPYDRNGWRAALVVDSSTMTKLHLGTMTAGRVGFRFLRRYL